MADTPNPPASDELEEVFTSADSMQVEMARDLADRHAKPLAFGNFRFLGGPQGLLELWQRHRAEQECRKAAAIWPL